MRKLKVAAAVAGLLIAVSVFVYLAFPIQLAELNARFDLWRENVQEIQSGRLHGYVADRCSSGQANTGRGTRTECTCVALVHGLADNAMTWKKLLLWPGNGWLSPVKLYAFDLPGSGGSPAPADPREGYRARMMAQELRAAMAPLCPKWIVLGNSLGGWVASWVALDWPEGVTRLILADSAGLKKSDRGAAELEAFRNPTVETLKEFQRRAYYQGRPLPDRVWRAAVERMRVSNARQIIEAQKDEDYLDARLPSLKRPTLFLWGQSDLITPISEGKALHSLVPGAAWHEMPQCGHLPQKECPLELIRAITQMIDYGSV